MSTMPMAMKIDKSSAEKKRAAREKFEMKRNKWVVKGKPKWTFCHTILAAISGMFVLMVLSIVYNYVTGAEDFP